MGEEEKKNPAAGWNMPTFISFQSLERTLKQAGTPPTRQHTSK